MAKLTACKECAHYVHNVVNKNAPEVWYSHFCAAPAVRRPKEFDPIEGIYVEPDEPFPSCRSINTAGNCKEFQAKQ